jgi:hypothetical protein
MALGTIPPWLQVTPSQFLEAAKAGSALGLQVGEQNNRASEAAAQRSQRAWEAQQQMAMKARELEDEDARAAATLAETHNYRLGEQDIAREHLAQTERGQLREADIARERIAEADRYHRLREQAILTRNDALAAHWQEMETIARDKANKAVVGAKIIQHPEVPGAYFLQQPTGHEQLLSIDGKAPTAEQVTSVRLRGANSMRPLGLENYDSPAFQARTNDVGQIMRDYEAKRGLKPGVVSTNAPLVEGAWYGSAKDPSKTYRIVNGKPVRQSPAAAIGQQPLTNSVPIQLKSGELLGAPEEPPMPAGGEVAPRPDDEDTQNYYDDLIDEEEGM